MPTRSASMRIVFLRTFAGSAIFGVLAAACMSGEPSAEESTQSADELVGATVMKAQLAKRSNGTYVYPRVGKAYDNVEGMIPDLEQTGIVPEKLQLFLRSFKSEYPDAVVPRAGGPNSPYVEAWVKNIGDETYRFLGKYTTRAVPRAFGPKLRSGDAVSPEGFYVVDDYRTNGGHYLALRLSNPNAVDTARAKSLGFASAGLHDVYIHGENCSDGCLAMGSSVAYCFKSNGASQDFLNTEERQIQELYVLALRSAANGGVPVHVFPFQMTDANIQAALAMAKRANGHYAVPSRDLGDLTYDGLPTFWKELQSGYAYFETNHRLPKISTQGTHYVVTAP